MAPYFDNGSLTTDKRVVDDTTTWDAQSDWEAYQSANNVEIVDGAVQLAEATVPDEEDLLAWYDATQISGLSDGDSVTGWSDASGNGHDLSATSAASYASSGINGEPVVEFRDSELAVTFSEQTQPTHVFIVFEIDGDTTQFATYFDGANPLSHGILLDRDSDTWELNAGNGIAGGDYDLNPHIESVLFDGPDSVARFDGSDVITGDPGSGSLAGITLGGRPDGSDRADVDVGEVLVYPQDKSGIVSDAESYLSDKWGIALS